MVKVKVKPNLELDPPQDFKPFDIDIIEIKWRDRCKLNNGHMNGEIPSFTEIGDIAMKYTGLKEEDIHKYSNNEIMGITAAIYNEANKKK
tara:strand:- start:167 stop:436 length:270 start_codon:yes stop_codon:yes gene_type:complete